MKPTLGWTMLSREEMRQAERLADGDQDTRDEIGFLLIHQEIADRFLKGTRIVHENIHHLSEASYGERYNRWGAWGGTVRLWIG